MTIDSGISPIAEPIEEKRVWGFWATVGFGAVIIVVFVIIQALVTAGVIFTYAIPELDLTSGTLDYEEIFNVSTDVANSYLGLIASISVLTVAVICGGLIILVIKAKRGAGIFEYLGWHRIGIKTAMLALAITAGYLAITIVASLLLDRPEQEITLDLYTTSVWPVLLWITVVIIGPAFEESFFRGFLFEGFRQSQAGSTWAILITSVVFAALHLQYDLYSMGQIFFMGLILGLVRLKTGSLWTPIIIHVVNNMIAMVLVVLTAEGILT